jgi:hypothetical protein
MEELLVLAGSNAGSRIHLTRPAGKKTTDAKKRLAKRLGELRLLQMIFAVNSPDLANLGGLRSILPFSVSVFSISALPKSPLFPRNPLFPLSERLFSVFSALGEKANS